MLDGEDIVASAIAAAGGRIVARVRLQKAIYLLQELGLKSKFGFEYHHYGPYSRDLDNAVSDARALKLIDETIERRAYDGVAYSVFTTKESPHPEPFKRLGQNKAQSLLSRFSDTNITVLELAATMHYLATYENIADWREETRRRKSLKASPDRLKQAEDLLRDIGLAPKAQASAA